MKYYLIAGEASGDLHGSNLMKAIAELDATAEFRYMGGDKMKAVGGTLAKDYREVSYMGFIEVLRHIRVILKGIADCKKDIAAYQPDALILIDFPGFNLRIAKWARQFDVKICYYISPQVWAWKAGRVKKMKPIIDRLYTILPFEKDFYKKYDWEVDYVGHPLLDVIGEEDNTPQDKPIIALLPGSRTQEIKKMLPQMLAVVPSFPDYQFVVGGAPSMSEAFYQPFLKKYPTVNLLQNKTYDLLKKSTAALVTSGTATLETALFGVPQVVCYKANPISVAIAKRLVKVSYISLVNLIMEKPLVKELIQDNLTTDNLKEELRTILTTEKRQEVLAGYGELKEKLGGGGASERVARSIVEMLS